MLLSRRCCNLAWPKSGSCILAWRCSLLQQRRPVQALEPAVLRVQQQHAAHAKRMLRILRRLEGLAAGAEAEVDGVGSDGGGGGDGGRRGGGRVGGKGADGGGAAALPLLRVEVEAVAPSLLPCGGVVYVEVMAAQGLLAGFGGPPFAAAAAAAAADDSQRQRCAAAAGAEQIVRQLLGGGGAAAVSVGSDEDSCEPTALRSVVKASEADAQLNSSRLQQPGRLFAAPRADGSKMLQHMELELLAGVQEEHPRRQPAAVLHAAKMAPHLALRFACCLDWQQQQLGATSGGDGTGGSAPVGDTPSSVAQRMRSFCEDTNSCVVAVDVHAAAAAADGGALALEATWLLHAEGLADLDRAELGAAILRHFA